MQEFEELASANKIFLSGTIQNNPIYSHETMGIKFYQSTLEVNRLSEAVDKLPIVYPEKLKHHFELGKNIAVRGEVRTYNKDRHLFIFVFVKEILTEELPAESNIVRLIGFICKEPIFRVTPNSKVVSDVMLAVNRLFKHADYIPCIAWGSTAKKISKKIIGTKIEIEGRLQSRDYQKVLDNGEVANKVAYEVSIRSFVVKE